MKVVKEQALGLVSTFIVFAFLFLVDPIGINESSYVFLGMTAIFLVLSCIFYYQIVNFINRFSQKGLYIFKVCIFLVFILVFAWIMVFYINKYNPNETKLFITNVIIKLSCVITLLYNIYCLFANFSYNVGFVTTCFPFKYCENEGAIQTRLIFNPHYNQWMFSGGHVDFQKGDKAEEIIKIKVKKEAGIILKNFINVPPTIRKYEHCTIMNAPSFFYILKVERDVECSKHLGHRKHIDMMYIAEYENNSVKAELDYVDVNLIISSDDTSIEKVRNKLIESLRVHYGNSKGYEVSTIPLLEDIPERLYYAIIEYKKYLELRQPIFT